MTVIEIIGIILLCLVGLLALPILIPLALIFVITFAIMLMVLPLQILALVHALITRVGGKEDVIEVKDASK